MNSDASYDKIKHLVEVEDDIFAVFTINTKLEMGDLSIAKNINFERNLIENIFLHLKNYLQKEDEEVKINTNISNRLGKLKWKILEYEQIRILKIFEQNKVVVVLIKSNTTLDETVDNILGYYYDDEEHYTPKSLF
jgi:adenine-specific DNA methylase